MTEQHEIVRRGDSFEVGSNIESPSGAGNPLKPTGMFMELLNNPSVLSKNLHLTQKQADNIASVLTGGGAAMGYKYLSKLFGPEIASAMGAALAAHVVKRLVKGSDSEGE